MGKPRDRNEGDRTSQHHIVLHSVGKVTAAKFDEMFKKRVRFSLSRKMQLRLIFHHRNYEVRAKELLCVFVSFMVNLIGLPSRLGTKSKRVR
jgi:hypothetical protein